MTNIKRRPPLGDGTIQYGSLRQDDAFEMLESIPESGIVNMFGAAPVLCQAVGKWALSEQQAEQALLDWMAAYRNRSHEPAP